MHSFFSFYSERRTLGKAAFFFCLLSMIAPGAAWAQRIISVVSPKDQAMDLKFDVNTATNDNIAPNILFTASPTRGLVAYAGSGTIVAFNPEDGKITATVKTGGRPSQIALTPDGKLLLAVDVFSNRVYAVEMTGFTLKATYAFDNAEFGFGNNIVFSADGKTGYISTFRYDPKFLLPIEGELIRFNVADGKEIGSRLKTDKGPTVITMSPDYATVAVVNTRSETVTLVDTAAFNVRATAKFDAGVDLTFLNNVAFSADSVVGVVCQRGLASQLLAEDLAYVFLTSTGQVVANPSSGISPLGAYLSPDGKYFYLMNEFGFNIVETVTFEVVQQVQSPYGDFKSNNNIVFRPDQGVGYLASPSNDMILSFQTATGGIETVLKLRGETDTVSKETLQVGISRDGKYVCAVKFLENTIACSVDTYNLSLSGLEVSDKSFTGFSLVNTSNESIRFWIDAVDLNNVVFINNVVSYENDQDQLVALTGTGKLAQSFQLLSDDSAVLVKAYLKKTGTFTSGAKLRATLVADNSGVPSDTVLQNATADIAADAVGADLGWVSFRFPAKVAIVASTTYWIVVEGAGSYGSEYVASSNVIEWGVDGSSPPYSSGQFASYTGSWAADSAKDALFSVVLSEVNASAELTLKPGEQLVGNQAFFSLDERERNGRIVVAAEKPGLKGYWVTGSRDLQRMDGDLATSTGYRDLVLPEVMQVGNIQTGFSSLSDQDTQVELTGSGKLAQSFKLEDSAEVSLIYVYFSKLGTFTSDAKLLITIQPDSKGKPSGVPLANASLEIVADSSLYTVVTLVQARFEKTVSLLAGTTYWIVVEGSGTYGSEYAAGSKAAQWGVDGSDPAYSQGQFATFDTEWHPDSGKDGLFSIILKEQYNLSTLFNIINRNYNFTSATYELFNQDGSSAAQQSSSVPGVVRLISAFEQIFSSGVTDRQGGYLRIQAAASIQAFEEFGTDNSLGILPAIPVNDETLANKRLYFPHFIADPGIDTLINVINLSRAAGYTTGQDELSTMTGQNKLAQSFQLETATSISLIRVLLQKRGTFSADATIRASIQSDSAGSPSGVALPDAVVEISAESIDTSLAAIDLRFSKGIALQAYVSYWLVLEAGGTYANEYTVSSKLIEWGVDGSSPTYFRGKFAVYDTAWKPDATKDAIFEIVLSEDNEITISIFSPRGALLAPPVKRVLAAGGQLRELLSILFPSLGYSQGVSGWIQIDSSKPGIVGDVMLSDPPLNFITAGLLQWKPISKILFAQIAQGSGYQTGWALLNAEDLPADVILDMYDTTGTLRATRTLRLNPKTSFVAYFNDVFPQISELLGGYAVVRSSQPLYSYSAFNNDTLSFIAMIPPQPF